MAQFNMESYECKWESGFLFTSFSTDKGRSDQLFLVLDGVGGQQLEVGRQGEVIGGERQVRKPVDANLFPGRKFEDRFNLQRRFISVYFSPRLSGPDSTLERPKLAMRLVIS